MQGAERALLRILKLLEALCGVDSGIGNEAGNRQVIEILRPILEELGAQVEEVHAPGLGTHLVVRVLPGGVPVGKLLLAAHLDTVLPLAPPPSIRSVLRGTGPGDWALATAKAAS